MNTYFLDGCFYADDGYTAIPASAKLVPSDHPSLQFGWVTVGKMIGSGSDGLPTLIDLPTIPTATRRQSACAAIDHAAGNARSHFATNSAFIESEYQRAYDTAVAWINSGYQGEAPAPVKSDAEAYGRTEQEAARFIKATGDYWFNTLDNIRDIRLKGKQAVETAPDDADFMAIAQPFVEQLEGLWPE